MTEGGLVDHWKFKYQQAEAGKSESEKYYAGRLAEALRRIEELEASLRIALRVNALAGKEK